MNAPAPVEGRPAGEVLEEPKRSLLERAGLRYFQQRGSRFAPVGAGALSAFVAAVAEVQAEVLLTGADTPLRVWIQYWSIVGGVAVIASIIEIGYLYWDSLRAVHNLSLAAGLPLFMSQDATREKTIAAALARAALELPNPTERLFGIDARREASKSRLLLASLAYKLKIAASNFVAKLILRRLMGRVIVRSALPFVAVPITAAWNGVVAWWVLREAKLRALGPSAIEEVTALLFPPSLSLSAEGRETVLRSIAASIVRTRDLHPNLRALLLAVHERVGGGPYPELDDPKRFLELLARLSVPEQELSLRLLGFAAVIDGRLSSQEQRLVEEARLACGRPAKSAAMKELHQAFTQGQGIDAELIRRIGE